MRILRAVLCVLAAALAVPASASFHTFAIQQLYSNADGSIQFIVLKEVGDEDGQQFLTGHAITSTQGGTQHKLIFPNDLPGNSTANRSFLIATAGFTALGLIVPDYTMPAGFLFTNGGTVNYAGVDQLTYAALPTDGVTALYSDGTMQPNLAQEFCRRHGVGDGPRRPGDGQRGRVSPCGVRSLFHHAGPRRNRAARRPRAAVRGLVADRVFVQRLRERRRAGGLGRHLPLLQRPFRAEELAFLWPAWFQLRCDDREIPGLGAGRRQAIQYDAAGRRPAPARPGPFRCIAYTTTAWVARRTIAS